MPKPYSCFKIFYLKGQNGIYRFREHSFFLLVSPEGAARVWKEGAEIYDCADHIICSDLLVKK
jgi:hypothetical protein